MSLSGPGRCYRIGISLIELIDRFPDDAAAERWFVEQRWPDGIACHYCGSVRVQTGCAHKTMPFRCRDCRKRFSVRTGTVMQSSKLGYRTWVIAMYLVATNLKGVSSMKLHRDLRVTQKTAWHLAHRIREMWRRNGIDPFTGPVEADEAYFGGKVKNMHKWQREERGGKRGPSGKTAVVAVKDRRTLEVRAAVLPKPETPFVGGFVAKHTTADTKLYTDESKAYQGFGNRETVKHRVGEYVRGGVSTNSVESFWSMLKRAYVGVFHRMSPRAPAPLRDGVRRAPQRPRQEHRRPARRDGPGRRGQATHLREADRSGLPASGASGLDSPGTVTTTVAFPATATFQLVEPCRESSFDSTEHPHIQSQNPCGSVDGDNKFC